MRVVTARHDQELIQRGNHSEILSRLEQGMAELVQCHCLNPGLFDQYRTAIESSLNSAISQLASIGVEASSTDQPWGWMSALDKPECSAGTLTVFVDQAIPLHDHPGSTGLLLMLQGSARVSSYRLVESDALKQPSTLKLEQTGETMLAVGQFTHFGPGENNIHSLQAIDQDCILFDLLFSPYQPHQRCFYMPVTSSSEEGVLYVSRLRKLHSSTCKSNRVY